MLISCGSSSSKKEANKALSTTTNNQPLVVGANQTDKYLPLLKNKKIAIVANQTSVIIKANGHTHLVDSLLALQIQVTKVFAPEHGFRGRADAGEDILDGIDVKTGLPLLSLHGKSKKPSPEQLAEVEMVIFDIQDVGARFYTYISTLHYVMEACAEANIPLLVLDRPNPNGHYVDGPSLDLAHTSFVGKHPIPLVHGMTIGEYAKMINGEGWLANKVQCKLKILTVANYTHDRSYDLTIRPSPNLPNDIAINLYPSLGFFEGTTISAGRGTELQFQIYGAPNLDSTKNTFKFTPQPNFGSKYPKHEGKLCYGTDLRQEPRLSKINLSYLLNAYHSSDNKEDFFLDRGFTIHAGNELLRKQIEAGLNEAEIKESWQEELNAFKLIRAKYLMYK